MSIGENIARLRKEKGWTQAEFGEMLGVSNQAVSKWESEMSMPDVMSLPQISKMFGVSIESLYKETDDEETIIDNPQNPISSNEDNRVLVILDEHNDSVVKTRVSVKAVLSLLANEDVINDNDLNDEEITLIRDVIRSKGMIVENSKGDHKTRITIEDYET